MSSHLPAEREEEEVEEVSVKSSTRESPKQDEEEQEQEVARPKSVIVHQQHESRSSEDHHHHHHSSPKQRTVEDQEHESRGEYASSVEEELASSDSPLHSRHPSVEGGGEAREGPLSNSFPPKTNQVLGRLNDIMGTGVGQPMRPSQLDNPPRKLLLFVPVLQVVNNNVS